MNIEQIINQCRKLRNAFERDEAKFFLGLVEIERTSMETITLAGHETFEVFLKRHELCEPTRYAKFAKGLALTTREKAEKMGTHAVMALASARKPQNVPKFEAAVIAWQEERGGVAPSRETSHRILRQVDPREEVPQVTRTVTEINRLRAENSELQLVKKQAEKSLTLAEENKALRAELQAAKKRIRDLEQENARLKKRAA